MLCQIKDVLSAKGGVEDEEGEEEEDRIPTELAKPVRGLSPLPSTGALCREADDNRQARRRRQGSRGLMASCCHAAQISY